MKIALISVAEENYWKSCSAINLGLREIYLRLNSGTLVSEWRVSSFASPESIAQMATEICKFKPHYVVFLDTSPLFGGLIHALRKTSNSIPEFVFRFHVYGDFPLRSYLWKSWLPDLLGARVEWACASTPQRKLVAGLLNDGLGVTWLCPFPVRDRAYKFDLDLRARTRRNLGYKSTEKIFVYTGRMSLQKNVLAIVKAFAQLDPEILCQSRLVFAGEFDDLGAPFAGVQLPPGGFYSLWRDTLHALQPQAASRIHLLRGLSQTSMRALLSAGDVFISLSLQHDEDFGMAPAEAAIAGLPLVLTEWGGYAGLVDLGLDSQSVPIELGPNGPEFKIVDVVRSMKNALSESQNSVLRKRRAQYASLTFSFSTARKRIRMRNLSGSEVSIPQFTGFQPLVKELAELYNYETGNLIFPSHGKGSVYEQIYRSYIGRSYIGRDTLKYINDGDNEASAC